MTREEIGAKLEEAGFVDDEQELLLADGFEEAFVGVMVRFGMQPLALYDRVKCIEILLKRDGMDEEGAEEFFEFNVIGAWAGEGTPAFLIRVE